MFKCIEFPGKEFATKAELFAHLVKNEKDIIAIKKAQVYESIKKFAVGVNILPFAQKDLETNKTIHMKDDCCYPVINTTMLMDSHSDVHLNGIWNKSAKEQNGKVFYTSDHKMETDKIIAWPSNVKVMVKSVPWSFLGADYSGSTEALMFEVDKSKIKNVTAKQIIEDKEPVQHSVSMQYVQLSLAINSNEPDHKAYKLLFDTHINSIANKDQVNEQGYFWAVSEAKIINEGSMVPRGSNPITPMKEKSEAGLTTSEEPLKNTQIIDLNLF